MFEHYTEHARRTIFFARYEASQYGTPYIESEQLLLALLREDKVFTSRLLSSPGAAQAIRESVDSHTVRGLKISTSADLPLSNELKRVLAYANEEAERASHKQIGPEHLLLGLLREQNCFAAQLLKQHGVTLAKAREDLQTHGARSGGQPPPPRSHSQAIPFGMPAPSLRVTDLAASVEFYKKLGFRDVYGKDNDPFRLLSGAAGLLALYTPALGENLVCFTGGDMTAVLARVKSGELHAEASASDPEASDFLVLRDPDGNALLLVSPNLRTL